MPNRSVTLVTYHYVRPLAGSQFPTLKALDLRAFEAQLDYFARHYQFVTMDTVIALFNGEPVELPPNPVLLTFDDGYADHFRYVFPRLFDRGVSGAFYPAAVTAIDRQILDANRVHFVLASIGDPDTLIEMIEAGIESERGAHQLWSTEQYRAEFMTASRFDEPRVAYAKRMLQFVLPDRLRQSIADAAFQRFVTRDEPGFAEELYMGAAELRTMRANGMHIGLHSDRHVWLGKLSREEQAAEITGSFRVLEMLGSPRQNFSFCFPYGNYNRDTLSLLDGFGCALALTTRSAVASLGDARLEVPRLDTNQLPRA
ncbi:polysaccharide deacetylase family protein [Desertibaculum subflavum]|uniref:polysaccharide deacetylase family protein n=1 Tax=Desertibaculum subflavum TaxID=2268458 RepID=UPI000E66E01F